MTKAAELAKMGEVLTNSQIGRKNIIINGAMQISQRSTSVSDLGGGSGGYQTLDRFRIAMGATSAGRYTMSQSAVTDLEGFSNALKIDCTTADTSIAAGEALIIQQRLEGFNLQSLKASSTSTRGFTLSFYAKSNASRAIASEITFSNGTNKQISKLHTIGTSWARYTMTVPAASSTQIHNDNSHEGDLNFWIHAGSTYSGGTINDDALDSITNANRAAGIGSIFASTDNEIEITGIQLEVGSQATPFEHRSFGEELELCKRYFQKTGNVSGNAYTPLTPYFDAATTSDGYCPIPLRPKMRLASAIAVSHSGVGELGLSIGTGTSAVSAVALQAAQSGEDFITIKFTSSDTLTQYRPMRVYANNDATAFIAFDAEL